MKARVLALLLLATPVAAAPPANDAAVAVKALATVCIDRQGDAEAMRAALGGWTQAPAGVMALIHSKPTPLFSKAFGAVKVTLDVGDNGICAAEMSGAEQSALRLAAEA